MNDYCVYCHIFPNGKRYIGITKDRPEKRWNNGHGYDTQPKMKKAIVKYGWENIKHEILAKCLTHDLANALEQHYISEFDTIKNGYNATIGGDNILTCYLDSYVLAMIRYVKNYYPEIWPDSGARLVYDDRNNKEAAAFWNEAAKAIQTKYGILSPTDRFCVERFWLEVDSYCRIYNMLHGWA